MARDGGLTRTWECRKGKFRDAIRLLDEVLRFAEKAWRYGLSRRSRKSAIGGEQCQQLLETSVLPPPQIVHHL